MQGRYNMLALIFRRFKRFKRNLDVSYLVFLEAILEDILHNQTASLAEGNFMPHSSESLVHKFHNLRW